MNMGDTIEEIIDLDIISEDGDEFDNNLYKATSHQEYDDRLLHSLQKARDDIRSFIVDEFITEAYIAATNLRNILGDSDGNAAELASIITNNLVIVLQNVTKDPASFVMAYLRAIEDEAKRKSKTKEIISELEHFSTFI